MASSGKCPYCGGTIRSDEANCPHCGAGNDFYLSEPETASFSRPQSIEELQEYCDQRGMPLERMRFFIGEDYRQPKAFGIYRDGADFVVYKNKSDGSRAVRYRGPDEARAVGELYEKLLRECQSRGIDTDNPPPGTSSQQTASVDHRYFSSEEGGKQRGRKISGGGWIKLVGIVLALLVLSGLFRGCGSFSFFGGSPFSVGSSSDSGYYSESGWELSDDDDWIWDIDNVDSGWDWENNVDSGWELDSSESGWGESDSDWGENDSDWDDSDSDWDWDDSDSDWDSDW